MNVIERMWKIIKSFFTWVFTNTIWTIVTYIFPFALLIPFFKNIYKGIVSKTYSLGLWSLLFFVIFLQIYIMDRFLLQLNCLNPNLGDVIILFRVCESC